MDERTDRWMDGWMDYEQMDGLRTDGWITNRWMDGWMGGWMGGL